MVLPQIKEEILMPKYDAVVIGAGNGGLAAACRMAKGGKKTLLIERHNMPGGCASSFRRGRFEFETALHEICEWGTKENPGGCRTGRAFFRASPIYQPLADGEELLHYAAYRLGHERSPCPADADCGGELERIHQG